MRRIAEVQLDEDGAKLTLHDGSEAVMPPEWVVAQGHPDKPIGGMWIDDNGNLFSEPPPEEHLA